ncbi:MAG: hypothetical protein AAGC53_19910, partial [Actinomycetota bacterium]
AADSDFRIAHMLAHAHTDMPVCPTGASGLGGILAVQRDVRPDFTGERVAVVFSGQQRPGDPRPL